MTRGRIAIIGAGGTLAMTRQNGGLAPSRSAADLVEGVRARVADVELIPVDAFSRPSANLGFSDVSYLVQVVEEVVLQGTQGVVITQGTDTIEETAFALELMCTADVPIAITGGMRGAMEPGADGPANLLGAIVAARGGSSRLGVMVVMNDEVHAARYVSKAHTTSLSAFTSGDAGVLGRIEEGELRIGRETLPRLAVGGGLDDRPWPRVALVKIGMDDDGSLIDAVVAAGFSGCIVEAMGAGHVPASLVERLEKLASRIPVVLASRTGRGRVCRETYGYPGSEMDLLGRNLIWSGALTGLKARVLMTICLHRAPNAPVEEFRRLVKLI